MRQLILSIPEAYLSDAIDNPLLIPDAVVFHSHRNPESYEIRTASLAAVTPDSRRLDRKRQSKWKSFLQYHWDVLASIDFTTIEVLTKSGLVTIYLLFFMELVTQRVRLAGNTTNPDEPWMLQIAINVSDAEEGFLRENIFY
jgi:hypothetical protein